jgi:hypothetical protein
LERLSVFCGCRVVELGSTLRADPVPYI